MDSYGICDCEKSVGEIKDYRLLQRGISVAHFRTLPSPLSNEIFYPDQWHCMIVICRSNDDPDPPLKRLTLFHGEVTLDRSWRGSGVGSDEYCRYQNRGGFKIAEYVTFLPHYSFQEGSRGWFVVRQFRSLPAGGPMHVRCSFVVPYFVEGFAGGREPGREMRCGKHQGTTKGYKKKRRSDACRMNVVDMVQAAV